MDEKNLILEKVKKLLLNNIIFLENKIIYRVKKVFDIFIIFNCVFVEIEGLKGEKVKINLNKICRIQKK